jgi:zinc protease
MVRRNSAAASRRPLLAMLAVAALAWLVVMPAAHATTIERVVSPKGIEAWLVHDQTVPLIALNYAFTGGTSQDPADKAGLAYMVSSLLDEGAGDLTSRAFQDKMEADAIELRFNASRDHFTGSLRTLASRRDTAFELLRLALNAPRFDTDAVERIRNQIAVVLRRESANPSDIVTKAWWSNAFPNHPYGQPQSGTPESIARIRVGDLRGYVHHVFARDHLKIAIVGDIDAAGAGALIDKAFGDLPAKAELTKVADAKPAGVGRRIVVDFDVPQSIISFGGPGLARKDPDFMAAYLVNHILGGGSFTSRLYQEVREKHGWAYGVNTYLYPMDHSALFSGWTQVRSERAGDALNLIEAEIRRMADSGPTADELTKAKAYLKGSFALQFDTSTKIAAQLVQLQLLDLGIDYINRRNELIDAVTLDNAKRVAKRLLQGGLLVAVVGRPAGITATPTPSSTPSPAAPPPTAAPAPAVPHPAPTAPSPVAPPLPPAKAPGNPG